MTDSWPLGWATGDIVPGVQYGKGIGSISDTTLGGSAASVDITSISSGYAHLLLVVYARGDLAAVSTSIGMRFNGDTAANYDYQQMAATAATVNPLEAFAATSMIAGFAPGNTAGANLFGATVAFIPHYAGSANNKACLSVGSIKTATTTGTMSTILNGGFWRSNSAITRITLFPAVSGNFVAGTRVTLYGLGA